MWHTYEKCWISVHKNYVHSIFEITSTKPSTALSLHVLCTDLEILSHFLRLIPSTSTNMVWKITKLGMSSLPTSTETEMLWRDPTLFMILMAQSEPLSTPLTKTTDSTQWSTRAEIQLIPTTNTEETPSTSWIPERSTVPNVEMSNVGPTIAF